MQLKEFRRRAHPKTPAILKEGWPPNVQTDKKAFVQWLDDLRARRSLYAQKPTLIENRTLDTPFRIKPISLLDGASSRRPIPVCAEKGGDVRLTLLRPLRDLGSQDNSLGRTWLAKTSTEDVVVTKFYCDSFFIPSMMLSPESL